MKNIDNVVFSSFLSNEEDADILYENDNDTIATFISFAVMEDKTSVDQKYIRISNIKLQIIFPKNFAVISHEYKLRYCLCTYNEHNGFFNENIFSRRGKRFSKRWYQDRFDKITVQWDTYPELIHENKNYTLAYVRVDEFDEQ